jgi:hypothetical protein
MKTKWLIGIAVANLMLVLGAAFILFKINMIAPIWSDWLSIAVAAIIVGLAFCLVRRPMKYMPKLAEIVRHGWSFGRVPDGFNWIALFHALYGGLLFFVAGAIGGGHVYGMDFTTPFFKGNLFPITIVGSVFGLFLFTVSNTFRYPLVITILCMPIWVFWSVVFSGLTKSPFITLAVSSYVIGSFATDHFTKNQFIYLSETIILTTFTLLPVLAYLSR